jgi:hypothetical protein
MSKSHVVGGSRITALHKLNPAPLTPLSKAAIQSAFNVFAATVRKNRGKASAAVVESNLWWRCGVLGVVPVCLARLCAMHAWLRMGDSCLVYEGIAHRSNGGITDLKTPCVGLLDTPITGKGALCSS